MPPSPTRFVRAIALGAGLVGAGCDGPAPGSPIPGVDLGPSLTASSTDPLLLTVAAPRERAQYLPDQGYTLSWDLRDVPSFATQHAGDFGVVLEIDGGVYIAQTDFYTPMVVEHTASDSVVVTFGVDELLSGEIWFVAGSSTTATLDVRLTSTAVYERQASVIAWVRRCDGPFEAVAPSGFGLAARHAVVLDAELAAVAPGTFLTGFADALAGDEAPEALLGRGACGADSYDDLGVMVNQADPPPATAALVGVRVDRTIPPSSAVDVQFHRAVVDGAHPEALAPALAAARALSLPAALTAGKARLDPAMALTTASGDDAFVYRSSFALLDQLVMPAEGALAHDYYLFSREPTWATARLGQGLHESLAMMLLARADPSLAAETQRNFIDRVEPDGFLPYSIGPVDSATAGGVAAPPLFSYESWEIARFANDPAFLADAYAAGQALHAFWTTQRDADQDGLSEWGGLTESLRYEGNVVYAIAPPDALEEVDLNSMLVMEERSLAAMATALGEPAEAAEWQATADARAARINAVMWDDATGFYYDVDRDTETFTYATPGDLKRMELAGFLPLWAGIVPDDRRPALLAHLADPSLFLRTYGAASLGAEDPSYTPLVSSCCPWDGPVWVPWQYLVVRGLLDYGETDLAKQITGRTLAAVSAQLTRTHQFRQVYDPDDRDAVNEGQPNYVWSSMAALMLLDAGPP